MATLVRVAELREAAARSQAARALGVTAAARQSLTESLTLLRAGGVVGGSRDALAASAQLQLVRAEAVSAAEAEVAAAEHAQLQAVLGWTDTKRRHRLFSELEERQRDAARALQEKVDQHLADELAAARRPTSREALR